jgi:CheY-like chemotaxis protein
MLDVAYPPSGGPDPVVLVVDDQAPVREVLRAGLQRHGFEVRSAANGRDAIESYYELSRENRDAAVTVLLDVQMPGLDGPLVLAALQAMDPGVRAFFMTGDPGRYGEDGLLATGARRVFAKPLDIAAVAAELRRGPAGVGPEAPAAANPSP